VIKINVDFTHEDLAIFTIHYASKTARLEIAGLTKPPGGGATPYRTALEPELREFADRLQKDLQSSHWDFHGGK